MSRTSKTVQQYVGCLLSMAKATLYDHPCYAEAVDEEALDKALKIVHNMMMREERKNANREEGAFMHLSEVGQ